MGRISSFEWCGLCLNSRNLPGLRTGADSMVDNDLVQLGVWNENLGTDTMELDSSAGR